jgi:hypothetical protein
MASELETRTTADQPTETPTTPAGTADAWDTDPDEQNYANGNNPEIAWRNQGNPDSPNGWGQPADTSTRYGDTADQSGRPADTAGSGEQADSWGEDPDLQNYPHWDQTSEPERGTPQTAPGSQADVGQSPDHSGDYQAPDGDTSATEQPESPAVSADQQRIGNLETDNADAKQRITDLEARNSELEAKNTEANEKIADLETKSTEADQKITDLEARNAELEAKNAELEAKTDEQGARLDEQAARMNRLEQLLAGPEKNPDNANIPDHGDTAISPDHQQGQDAATAEHETGDVDIDRSDAGDHRWRRVVSSGGFEIASAAVGAAGTVSDFAMHPTPVGVTGVAATAFGLGALGLKRLEQRRKGKG